MQRTHRTPNPSPASRDIAERVALQIRAAMLSITA
jgi:hypothetical protein